MPYSDLKLGAVVEFVPLADAPPEALRRAQEERLGRAWEIPKGWRYWSEENNTEVGKWYMAEPRLVSADFIHPMPAGARIVGTLLYQALMDGYNSYKLKQLRRAVATAAPAATPTEARP